MPEVNIPFANESVDQILARLRGGSAPMREESLLLVKESQTTTLTVAEVRAIANKNPENGTAKLLLQGTSRLPPNEKVTVNTVDLEAALLNKTTVYVKDLETLPLAPGEQVPEEAHVQRKVLADDPNIRGKVTSPTPFR